MARTTRRVLRSLDRRGAAMTAKAALALVLVLTAAGLAVPGPAAAQVEIGGFRLEGDVEVGWRFLVDEPAKSRRAKWEEYRDFPGGPFLSDLELRIFRPDESYWAVIGGQQMGADRPGVLPPRGAARPVGVRVRLGPDSPRLLDRRPLPRHAGLAGRLRVADAASAAGGPQLGADPGRDRAAVGRGADVLPPHAHAGPGAEGRIHADPQERRPPLQHGVRQPRQQLLPDPRAHRSDYP